jgi:hypothetical protein
MRSGSYYTLVLFHNRLNSNQYNAKKNNNIKQLTFSPSAPTIKSAVKLVPFSKKRVPVFIS